MDRTWQSEERMRDSLSRNSVNMFSEIFPAKILSCLCFYICVFVCFSRCKSFLTFTSVLEIVNSLLKTAFPSDYYWRRITMGSYDFKMLSLNVRSLSNFKKDVQYLHGVEKKCKYNFSSRNAFHARWRETIGSCITRRIIKVLIWKSPNFPTSISRVLRRSKVKWSTSEEWLWLWDRPPVVSLNTKWKENFQESGMAQKVFGGNCCEEVGSRNLSFWGRCKALADKESHLTELFACPKAYPETNF